MENNDPYKKIREKLENYEETPSPKSWESIELRLAEIKLARGRRIRTIYYAAAAVAASLLLLITINNTDNQEIMSIAEQSVVDKTTVEQQDVIVATTTNSNNGETSKTITTTSSSSITQPQQNNIAMVVDKRDDAIVESTNNSKVAEVNNSASQTDNTVNQTDNTTYQINNSVKEESNSTKETKNIDKTTLAQYSSLVENLSNSNDVVTKAKSYKSKSDAGYSLSLVSTNALSSTAINTNNSLQNPFSEELNLYSSKEPLEYDHKMPISIGFNVEKRWKNSWGLESGLSYTLLRSDYHSTDNTQFGEQVLHYVGVPLQVTYRFAEVGLFGFYAAAGPKIDINVSGKRTEFAENETAKADATAKVRDKYPQFSLLLRGGAACKIVNHLELYLEPSLAYYIPNGGDMATLWQDKPISFVLQVGLRSSF